MTEKEVNFDVELDLDNKSDVFSEPESMNDSCIVESNKDSATSTYNDQKVNDVEIAVQGVPKLATNSKKLKIFFTEIYNSFRIFRYRVTRKSLKCIAIQIL